MKGRCVRVTIVAVEKAISIIYSECVSVALVIRHAKRMRRIILLSVASPFVFHIISKTARFSEKRC